MAEPTPAPTPPPAANTAPKAPSGNPALRMLGLPNLPRKLPSRNWMIFWTISGAITAAVIYDKREKKRAIAKWSHAVEHLAKEPLPHDSLGLAQPRKLTIYLSSPPGDGLRVAQDHYTEYVKPILAASGLDWEFVQGRREGDVRAYVAERVRRLRRSQESNDGPDPTKEPTREEIVEAFRKSRGIKEYDGVRGDIVIGRHTWKEYLRGLHEGWLGPLAPPPEPEPLPLQSAEASESSTGDKPAEDKPAEEKPTEEDKKPKRPPQPRPHNTTADYPSAVLPSLAPNAFDPSAPIREPHLLGFLNTPTRLYRFFNRRKLADEIGREVAAVCLCTHREYKLLATEADSASPTNSGGQPQYEQERELAWEEKDWIKSIWKEDDPKDVDASGAAEIPEKVRAKPIVMDPRIAERMRRFQLRAEDEERASKIVVPEEEIEGWIKGKFRQLYRWSASKAFEKKKTTPLEDKDVE
ncbi:hypothetical protein VTI28DRAFT_10022 [Corynascus sepedonium]